MRTTAMIAARTRKTPRITDETINVINHGRPSCCIIMLLFQP
jgi:hypothetical protein